MLHIIAGEKSAAYDGALFAILLPIFLFFDRRMAFLRARQGVETKKETIHVEMFFLFP